MLDQTFAITSILAGRDSGWNPQQRDESALPWRELLRAYWRHTLVGAGLALVSLGIEPSLSLWLMPVWLGLLFSIPLARWLSRRASPGAMPAPEDLSPPQELTRAKLERAALAAAVPAGASGLERLLASTGLFMAHLASLPNLGERAPGDFGPERLVARVKIADSTSRKAALALLTSSESRAALSDRRCLHDLLDLEP